MKEPDHAEQYRNRYNERFPGWLEQLEAIHMHFYRKYQQEKKKHSGNTTRAQQRKGSNKPVNK